MFKKTFFLLAFVAVTVLLLSQVDQQLLPIQEYAQELFAPKVIEENIFIESNGSQTNILYQVGDAKKQLNSGSANVSNPFRRGDFVVWVESPLDRSEKYVVRYHLPTHTELKLTTEGVSEVPKVNVQGRVVWQQWNGKTWQIEYFDGSTTHTVTKTLADAVNPDIAGMFIVYAQQQSNGAWTVERYNTQTKKVDRVREPSDDALPYFEGEKLVVKK